MNYLKVIRFSCVLVALVAALAARSTGASGIAHQAFKCGQWNVVPSQNPYFFDDSLNSVAAVSPNDVWAVGNGGESYENQTLIEHWNGAIWRVVKSPNIIGPLSGVVALSTTNVWAVGWTSPKPGQVLTLIEHWNGSTWNIVPSPSVGTYGSRLTSVAELSPTDIWAAGYYELLLPTNRLIIRTLIEHWDGSQWTIVTSPNVGSNDYLFGVTALTSNDVWAVGYDGSFQRPQALAEHWDGKSWQITPTPTANSQFFAVTASASNEVWAVGALKSKQHYFETLAELWNGSQWKIVKSPGKGKTSLPVYYGVAADATNDVWAVGSDTIDSVTVNPLTAHWNGKQWTEDSSPIVDNIIYLQAVTRVAVHSAWAVGVRYGFQGDNVRTLTEYYC